MIPNTYDGSVEALRALQIVHRSVMKSRTQDHNQLGALVVTAPESVRTPSLLMLAAGDDPDRLGSPAASAALLGSGPIHASSGKTTRMRLNRGGDRQGSSTLWRIVICRMATQPATETYVLRRTGAGRTKPGGRNVAP